MRDNATCLDFVQFYATDDLASIIVTLTNRYADQYLLANAEKTGNSYLHENYNANNENQDRLHRLRPLIF